MAESPFYKHHIFCCTNQRGPDSDRPCCANSGGEVLRAYFKKKVKELGIPDTRVNNAGCLNRCELGPTMVIYPEGIWYSCKTTADIDEVIAQHLLGGKIVERLQLRND